MNKFQSIAEDELLHINSMYSLFAEHLKGLPDVNKVSLRKSGKAGGKSYYYLHDQKTGKRTYLGTGSNSEVRRIKEARFCRELISRAEKDQQLLRKIINEYCPLDYESVNERLPCTYRGADIIIGSRIQHEKRAEEWKRQKEAFKNSIPVIYPNDLKHTAIDGTRVRSKSELTIANMLFTNKVPYIYECPHFLGEEILRFDFTALSTIDYESEVIVEHQGMMDLDTYRDKYMHTLLTCLSNELIPNVDIFFTFEDVNGNFDSRQIWDIIKTRLIQID